MDSTQLEEFEKVTNRDYLHIMLNKEVFKIHTDLFTVDGKTWFNLDVEDSNRSIHTTLPLILLRSSTDTYGYRMFISALLSKLEGEGTTVPSPKWRNYKSRNQYNRYIKRQYIKTHKETGERTVYNHIDNAERQSGISKTTIYKACRDTGEYGDYYWEFIKESK